MYQGKFDQKKKGGSGNVRDIVAQRNQPAAPDLPDLKAAPRKAPARPDGQPRPASPAPRPQQARPQQPRPQQGRPAPKAPVSKEKQGPRLGGVIFYTLYFLFILIFFIATFVGLLWLKGWLQDFEASQPTVKCQQVFDQLFTDPDWSALYEASGAKDSPYEGKDAFVSYMQEKVGDQKLTYLETSAGLSGGKKYVVRLGNEKVASFTLVDKNQVDDDGLKNIGKLKDWQLDSVEVFFERSGSYRIEKVADHIAYVNGVALDDSFTIQKATTKAEDYLPVGVTSAKMYTQEVTGLMNLPTVTVTNKEGQQMEVTYDAETRTFTERTVANTISQEEEDFALKTAETYALWMLEEVKDRGTLAKYFDSTSTPYKTITTLGKLWVQDHSGYEFVNQKVTNYERYADDLFSVRVSMNVNVTRMDGTTAEFATDNTLFFRKNDSGNWRAFEMTNVDVSAPQGQVRLTFMNGSEMVHTNFFPTDATQIITPIISVPDGKVFSGWVLEEVDENGVTTWNLMFQPDETGTAIIPEGMDLKPMTLLALFEDLEDVAVPPETAAVEGAE